MAHHRSGSNFLHDLLQSHPRIECINEPLSMHTRFFRQCDLVRWSEADYDPVLLHVALAKHGGLRAYLSELRLYLLRSDADRVMGFKETALFGKLEWLKEFLPTLKIVFLTRDPRAVVSSVLRSGLSEFWRYRDLVPRAFYEICPHYQRRSDESADPAIREAEIAAMSVVARYEIARRSVHLFEHRLVALEDVMRDPAGCLEAMTAFLGVDPHPDAFSFLRQRQGVSRGGTFSSFRAPDDVQTGWRRHLSAGQIEVIEDVLSAPQRESPRTAPATQLAWSRA
ncbi:MAG TPA: sulfotransferase [Burkholderiaceae bacterium]